MDDQDDFDVDFDFKSMLSQIDDNFEAGMLSPAPAASTARNAPPLHPRQHQALSIGEILDSRLFKPDAPWSIGTNNKTGLTAAPPPSGISYNGGMRTQRSNSGAIISARLRAASDMHQQGYLTSEEKSLMKDLILSHDPQFKEEFSNAERTNNWHNLQQFIRTYHLRHSPADNFNMAMEDLTHEFGALNTPPPPGYPTAIPETSQIKSARKRMASQSTPVARPRKTTTSAKKQDPTSQIAMKSRSATFEDPMNGEPPLEMQSNSSGKDTVNADVFVQPTKQQQRRESPPATEAVASSNVSSTFVSKLPTKPISQMDDKELEIEAAIAAAEGDPEAVAKIRKNERERRRRLAVSNGFDELYELLKLPQAAQLDKVSILRKAIERIRELEAKVKELEERLSNQNKTE